MKMEGYCLFKGTTKQLFKVKFQSVVKCNKVPDPKAIHEDDDNFLFSGSMHVKIAAIAAPIECPMI
jgi:hypothetical protein